MTRLPMEDRNVSGVDGPEYALNVICAAPGCGKYSRDPHHLWRRSELGGPFAWVEYEGEMIGNLVGLCQDHHHQVTVGSAWIDFDMEGREFNWCSMLSPPRILEWQPPFDADRTDKTDADTTDRTDRTGICPSCKRPLPHERLDTPKEARRPRRTWSITVPVDERENGADVLDSLLEASR